MFLVFVYMWLPFMILPMAAALERVPGSLLQASADLGAKPSQTFRNVVLPLAVPGIAAGSVFTFSLTLGDYIIPSVVGAPGYFIGMMVYVQQGVAGNIPLAAAFSAATILAAFNITPTHAQDLQWQVENPFRFFKSTRSFALHEAAYNAARGKGDLPGDVIWRTERRLNDPDCRDSSSPDRCAATAGKRSSSGGPTPSARDSARGSSPRGQKPPRPSVNGPVIDELEVVEDEPERKPRRKGKSGRNSPPPPWVNVVAVAAGVVLAALVVVGFFLWSVWIVLTAVGLAWARTLGEFGATITFAGNFPGVTQTLPIAVYISSQTNFDKSIAVSVILLAVSFAVLATLGVTRSILLRKWKI